MIVLYNPQSSRSRKPVMPFNLLSLGTLLEGRHKYCIIDGNLSADATSEICDRLVAGVSPVGNRCHTTNRCHVLGVTVMPGPQVADALWVTRRVRERVRNVVIVWGGYFPTQHPEVCLRESTIDYVMQGYGEQSFLQLVDQLNNYGKVGSAYPTGLSNGDLKLDQIAGLCHRSAATARDLLAIKLDDGQTMVQNDRAAVPDPNEFPPFPYHRIDMPAYVRSTWLGRRTLSHHSSVGCPYTCNYCAVTGMAQGRYRAETPHRTARTVARLVTEYGADSIEFFDNNFFVREPHTAELCERIKPQGIAWWAEGRMDTLLGWGDRTWRLMADSGCKMIFMGAEAASDDRLRKMHRGGTLHAADALTMANRCRRYGIIPEFSFVMGSLPDPAQDINDTLSFVRSIKHVNPDSEIILYLYAPVPVEGDLYRAALEQGFRFPDTLDEWASEKWISFIQRRSRVMPWLPHGVHAHLKGFELTLNAYYPTRTDPRLTTWRRAVLRVLGAWRYHLRFYRFPIELRMVHRLFRYQRPETTGF